MNETTLKKAVSIEGIGLHTGRNISIKLRPSPANSGINFIRVDLPNKPLINVQSLDLERLNTKERRTVVSSGDVEVHTVEHLMAALAALSVDNIIIEVDNMELPGLDGSAKGFFDALKSAGVKEYDSPKKTIRIKDPAWVEDADSFLGIFPAKELRISYILSYKSPRALGGFYDIVVDEKNFEREIAPARTFCFEEEALALLKKGLGKGANYDNTLVIGENGPVKNAFRFDDEPVRHKILDLIGDLYVLGCRLEGRVVAIKSGHRLNMELVRKLKGKR